MRMNDDARHLSCALPSSGPRFSRLAAISTRWAFQALRASVLARHFPDMLDTQRTELAQELLDVLNGGRYVTLSASLASAPCSTWGRGEHAFRHFFALHVHAAGVRARGIRARGSWRHVDAFRAGVCGVCAGYARGFPASVLGSFGAGFSTASRRPKPWHRGLKCRVNTLMPKGGP